MGLTKYLSRYGNQMIEVIDPAVRPDQCDEIVERIECSGVYHNGPSDGSKMAIKYAAQHDPEAPAEYLLICPCCDAQSPYCAKKINAILEHRLTGNGRMKCVVCNGSAPIIDIVILPL